MQFGAPAVAARAPGLLHVLLERARRVVVHHVADVGLVDAEAEGVGRDHHGAAAAAHEAVLVLAALRRVILPW